MEFIKRYKKLKRRKLLTTIVKYIKLYRRSGLGVYTNQQIRNKLVKNHLSINRKKWLTVKEQVGIILANKENGTSKRVADILKKL